MIKVHGLSKEEVQSIVKKGIPMEKKTPRQETQVDPEAWRLEEDQENSGEDDWNDVLYEYNDGEP